MTKAEWKLLVAELRAHWPHTPIEIATQSVWFDLLSAQDAQAVHNTILLFAVEGAQFPPTGARS